MLNRPTVRVRCRFPELEACALKRASLRAPSSFQQIVENQMRGMLVLPSRSCACALLAMSIFSSELPITGKKTYRYL